MQALLLLAHTNPSLVNNIINNKLGKKIVRVDPKKNSLKRRIVMFTDLAKARSAIENKQYANSLGIAVCSPLDAQQIKGAIALDFTPTSLNFVAGQLCKFDTIFDLYAAPNITHKVQFKSKALLTKIIDFKMSTNIISLSQTLLYDIAVKSKRKQLRKILIAWLSFTPATRPNLEDFLAKQEHKFKDIPKALKRKTRKWQENDKLQPIAYAKFLSEAKGKTNKDIADIALRYNINAFDGITLCTWLKGL